MARKGTPRIAVIGAGMGGLTVAATLLRAGFEVDVYEQARQFTRLGAGIQMSPNAMKVLRAIGLEDQLRDMAYCPPSQYSRKFDTGELFIEVPFGEQVEKKYGAPYLLMHRGDLHAALTRTVPAERIHLGRKLSRLTTHPDRVELTFQDGSSATADAVIGADGVHSLVRETLLGPAAPTYTGRVAYRTTFSAALLNGYEIDHCTKWWGPDRHIVIYYVTRAMDEIYFVTSVPEPSWTQESWSMKGDVSELRAAFAGFHPQVQAVLNACPEVHKWAINIREPLPSWSNERIVLLGDSCHPMTPYMAQGAATSMEDAAVLTRCLEAHPSDLRAAFATYEEARKERTAQIQRRSYQNDWLHRSADTDWVYGYDAWEAPLGAARKAS